MSAQHTADNVLIDLHTESQRDLLRNARTTPAGVTLLHGHDGLDDQKIGPANRSTATRRSSASFAPPEPKLACRSLLTWTGAAIQPAPNRLLHNSKPFASSRMRSCPNGTTPSLPICEIVFAPALSARLHSIRSVVFGRHLAECSFFRIAPE